MSRLCGIADCAKPMRTAGLCLMHYTRKRRTGDPLAVKPGPIAQPKSLCVVEGCENTARTVGPGLCSMHRQRVRAHGTTDAPPPSPNRYRFPRRIGADSTQWKGDQAGYSAIHLRLARIRGRAAEHACVDCAGPAAEWSYDNTDPDARIADVKGCSVAYSTDLERYVPRCHPCHRNFDLAHRRSA